MKISLQIKCFWRNVIPWRRVGSMTWDDLNPENFSPSSEDFQ